MDPYLAVGNLVEAGLKIVKRYMHSAVDVTLGPFVVAPNIEHSNCALGSGVGEFRE